MSAQGVGCGVLGDAGGEDCAAEGPLKDGLVEVMPATSARPGIGVVAGCGEDPLPGPLAAGGGVLAREGVG